MVAATNRERPVVARLRYASWVTSGTSGTAAAEANPSYVYLILKPTWSEFQKASHTTTERGKAELHIYNLKETSPPQNRSQAVVCVSTPRMYPQSGYFLVT